MVYRYYTSTSAEQVLDLIQCIDRLGIDRAPAKWLLDALLAPRVGPEFRYISYATQVIKGEQVWRYVVMADATH